MAHSRFTQAILPWGDFWENTDGLLEQLMSYGLRQPEPPALFYQEDAQLLLVSRHRASLAKAFRFIVPDADLVEDLVDKGRFHLLAERVGLPVPPTRRLRPTEGSEAPDLDLPFPVVIKPLTRTSAWPSIGGEAKALMADSPAALRELWPRLTSASDDLLVQTVIPGPETRIESYHVYVDLDGKVAGEFTGRKIRTYPLSLGHSTALAISDAADVAELGRAIIGKLQLRGVAKLDFKRGPDDQLHLLEINPRFNLWHHLAAAAGMNLPALVYADLLGLPRPAVARPRVGACWLRPSQDRRAARESGMSRLAWLAWAARCDANASFSWDDPMPWLRSEALPRLRGKVSSKLKRLRSFRRNMAAGRASAGP